MSSPTPKDLEIEDERRMERRYAEQLRSDATLLVHHEGPRSGRWTGTGMPQRRALPLGEFIGRVALTEPDEGLGGATNFYIGHAYANVDGVDVYNWRNPFGRSFFCGTRLNPSSDNVAAVRTFEHGKGVIVDFVDDVGRGGPAFQPFCRRRGQGHSPHSRPVSPPSQGTWAVSTGVGSERDTSRGDPLQGAHDARHAPVEQESHALPEVRAEPLLLARLSAPRPSRLAPALSTLQPDQYDLVTAPAMDSMIVEGGPGTGKSIIASHRAAYFIGTDAASGDSVDGDVLVVGPTTRYVAYVSDVINELTGNSPHVTVMALSQLTNRRDKPGDAARNGPRVGAGGREVPRELVQAAVAYLTAGRSIQATEAQVYECLLSHGTELRPLTDVGGWRSYLRSLPTHAEAVTNGTHWLFRASIKRHLAPHPEPPEHFRHIIVDEAQDVTQVEWSLLRELNDSGAWTIIGDFNQRRADRGLQSWPAVLDAVGLPPRTPCRQLQRGYRSTVPILEFANRLLQPGTRAPLALQSNGPEAAFVKTILEHRTARVVQQVDRLASIHAPGTVAVITTMPGAITSRLRGNPDRTNVIVLGPSEARGLEFDAVVVVEPSEFPRTERRYGALYTALTRANRELVIVYTKPLPPPLRSIHGASEKPSTSQPARPVPRRKTANKPAKRKRRWSLRSGGRTRSVQDHPGE